MTTRIKLRRDTAANWTANNPILAAGEPGLETDTGKTKYGDGTSHWADLNYATGGITARQIVGSFTGYGPSIPNYSNYDIWFDTVVADPDGNAYYVGGQNDTDWMVAVKIDGNGEVVWEKEVTWADGYEGSGVSAVYNTATDQVVIVGQFYRNYVSGYNDESGVIIKLDAADGSLVGDPTVIRDDVTSDGSHTGWVEPTDIILAANGDPIIAGDMGGAPQVFNVTTATGSTVNDLFVDSAQFLDKYPMPYNDWWVTGTNISSEIFVTAVNYYYNQPSTNIAGGTGTNALFDITADGAGGYTVVLGTNQGSGYQYLNQILVLGSLLGGVDVVNDATVTVQGIDPGGVITSVTVTGLSTGSSTYTGVSGVNIPSGTGATFTANWRMKGSQIWFPNYQAPYYGIVPQQGGSGYAIGDTIALAPECYGGLTTGTITVTNMNGSGAILDWTFTGTFNTSIVKITTDNAYNADYSVEGGTYQLHVYDAEAFVWTPDWARTFGGADWDQVNALARDSGGNIYAAGQTYDYSTGGDTRGFLVKMTSTGSLVWSKNFDPAEGYDYNNGYTGVAVDSDDNVIVVQDEQITKVDADGVILWQQVVAQGEMFGMWNACVDVDSDNNIYVAAEFDYINQVGGDNYLIIKLDTDGNVLWQREAGSAADEDTRWNDGYQIITVKGNRYYVCGSSYYGGDDVGFAMDMPTDGSGDGNYAGRYFYNTTTWALTTTTGVVDEMEMTYEPTDFTVYTTNTFAVNTLTNVSEVRSIRTGDVDGRINNLYSLSFEDGSVQTSAYVGGLTPAADSPHVYDTNNRYLTLADAGKMHRWITPGWNATVWIYVPANAQVAFPIGTQMHFMKDEGLQTLWFFPVNGNNDITIMPTQPNQDYGMQNNMYDSGEGWSVHAPDWSEYPCIVTLTKVDTDRWLLSCNSPTQIMDWSW